jgi:hypothetical protein
MTGLLDRLRKRQERQFLEQIKDLFSNDPLPTGAKRSVDDALRSGDKYLLLVNVHGVYDPLDLHEQYHPEAATDWKHLRWLLKSYGGRLDVSVSRVVSIPQYVDAHCTEATTGI